MSHGQFEFLLIFKIFMIPLHIYLGFNKTYVIFAIKKKKKKNKEGEKHFILKHHEKTQKHIWNAVCKFGYHGGKCTAPGTRL